MNFFETRIQSIEKRLKRIEENPNPKMMRSNKMLYELERDMYREKLQWWKDGKPFADGGGWYIPFFRTMGFQVAEYAALADRAGHMENYLDTIRLMGLPENACDRLIVLLAMCERGELPPPGLLSTSISCEPARLCLNFLAKYYDTPSFFIDFPLDATNETLQYATRQLEEFIEYIEKKFPGHEYHEDKLIEMMEIDKQAYKYLREIAQFRKQVPCPLAGKDTFRLPRLPSVYPDGVKALEYMKIYRDEVAERASKGLGAVKEEKLRVMWTVSGPYFVDPFEMLEKRGVTIPVFQIMDSVRVYGVKPGTFGDELEFGRKLSPLEEISRMMIHSSWGRRGEEWIDDCLAMARDFKIDAIINFVQVGCTATANLAKPLEDAAQKELGIPTLQIYGRQLHSQYFEKNEFEAMLDGFITMCLDKKGV